MRELLVTLSRAGRAHTTPNAVARQEEQVLADCGLCKSDDPHIIALAREGGARTVCTQDQDLMNDFKNRRLICSPRGKVYQYAKDAPRLLRHTSACKHEKNSRAKHKK